MFVADRLASHAAAGTSGRHVPAAAAAAYEQRGGRIGGGSGRGGRSTGGRSSGRSRPPQRRHSDEGDPQQQQSQRRDGNRGSGSGDRRYGGTSSGRGGGGGGRSGRSGYHQQRAAPSKAQFFTSKSFKATGASEEMVAALKGIGIARPSHIQAAAYKLLLSDAPHVALADHAGSGKTLAYLAPLVQQLRQQEAAAGRPVTQPNCPRLLIITPTEELCQQVLAVVRGLAKGAPLRSAALTGGRPWRTQREALDQGVDVVVAAPGRAREHLSAGTLRLDACAAVVLDEADLLLSDTAAFAEQVAPLREAAPPATRFVLVTATLPAALYDSLAATHFPGLVPALGPGLHCSAPGVLEQVLDCSGGEDITEESGRLRKLDALLQLLRVQPAERTIVFCNKIDTCRVVENALNRASRKAPDHDSRHSDDFDSFNGRDSGSDHGSTEAAFDVLPYHAAITPPQRAANLQAFMQPPRFGGQPLILVASDRASRGIDLPGVGHVVLFDFPRDPSEYVRRAGRTARGATGRGIVSVLVLGRQVKLAKEIVERNSRGAPIHEVPAPLATLAGMRSPPASVAATAAMADLEGHEEDDGL